MATDPEDSYTTDKYGNLPKDAPWWARWVVENWREGWRWWSSNWSLLCGFATEAYAAHPGMLTDLVPATWLPHIAAAAFMITSALRFVQQKNPTSAPTQTKETP